MIARRWSPADDNAVRAGAGYLDASAIAAEVCRPARDVAARARALGVVLGRPSADATRAAEIRCEP